MAVFAILSAVLLFLVGFASFLRSKNTANNPATPCYLEKKHRSLSYSPSRVRFVILHFTQLPFKESLEILTKGAVSAHYLVPETGEPIYALVDEDAVAHHAGLSFWGGKTYLNDVSIGIEIVNPGCQNGVWQPYPPAQIDALISLLKEIKTRHDLEPTAFLGHSDIAPDRKDDPGPLFPWQKLYQSGIGAWHDDLEDHPETEEKDISWLQSNLKRYGYKIEKTGTLDEATKIVTRAFQMHFQPQNISGIPDAETYQILDSLVKKYK